MNTIPQVTSCTLKLDVDVGRGLVRGHAELAVTCPRQATTVGLHAHQLRIKRVTVDGVDAPFTLRPRVAEVLPESVIGSEDTSNAHGAAPTAPQPTGKEKGTKRAEAVADHSFFQYERTLQREAEPELSITLAPPQEAEPAGGSSAEPPSQVLDQPSQSGQPEAGGGARVRGATPALMATTPGARSLRIAVEYEAGTEGGALRFWERYAITDNQLRRARGWFPCVDTLTAAYIYNISVTVDSDLVAIAPGTLLRQVLVDSGRRKTFSFSLEQRALACHVALAIGPFGMLEGMPAQRGELGAADTAEAASGDAAPPEAGDENETMITHFAPPEDAAQLAHTVSFMPLALGLYQDYLACPFPYPSFHQVFVPGELAPAEPVVAAGMQILSRDLLFDDSVIDQALESRMVMVRALARMWFGVFLRPRAPPDAWVLEGLAAHLEGRFIRTFLGRNEYLHRRLKEREVVAVADDGHAAPLYPKGPAYAAGVLHGTEALDPSPMRRWKAAAVMAMLERKGGEDTFQKLLERLVSNARQTGPKGEDMGDGSHCTLATQKFLIEVGKAAGFKKEMESFHERWIAGRGCPRITAAFVFHKKGNTLEVALQQAGNAAARKATERALATASKEGSVGIVKVGVQEVEGPMAEHPVNLAANRFTLTSLSVRSKVGKTRPKPRRKKKGQAEEDGDDDEEPEDILEDSGAARVPVQWVVLDPQGETLAAARVLQPEYMWAAQLERSRDVQQQSSAVAGLAALQPTTYGVVNALRSCLHNANMYCRVRMEAALALGRTANERTEFAGLEFLIKFYRKRMFDPHTQWPRAPQSAAISDYLLDEIVPTAIASVRDAHGSSPPEAVDFLLEVLDHWAGSHSGLDDGNMVAALLDALGCLMPQSLEALERIVSDLERYLRRDGVLPAFQRTPTRAALTALTRLATSLRSTPAFRLRLLTLLERYKSPAMYHKVRRAAYACTASILAAQSGLDAALACTLADLDREPSLAVRCGMLEDFLAMLHSQVGKRASHGISGPTLRAAHALLSEHSAPRTRHLAFMLLARLGNQAPTLFRDREEDDIPVGPYGPAMSLETMTRRQRPAASGMSLDSGQKRAGGPVVRLKALPSFMAAPSATRSRSNFSLSPPISEAVSHDEKGGVEVVSGVRQTRMRSGHLPPRRVWDDGSTPPPSPPLAPVLNAAGMRTRRSHFAMEESLRPSASGMSGLSSPMAPLSQQPLRVSPTPAPSSLQPSLTSAPPPAASVAASPPVRALTIKLERGPSKTSNPPHAPVLESPAPPPMVGASVSDAHLPQRPSLPKLTLKLSSGRLPAPSTASAGAQPPPVPPVSEPPPPVAPPAPTQRVRIKIPLSAPTVGGGAVAAPPKHVVAPPPLATSATPPPPMGSMGGPSGEPPRVRMKARVPAPARPADPPPPHAAGLQPVRAPPSAQLESRPSERLRETAAAALQGDDEERERGALLLDVMEIMKAAPEGGGKGGRRRGKAKPPKPPSGPKLPPPVAASALPPPSLPPVSALPGQPAPRPVSTSAAPRPEPPTASGPVPPAGPRPTVKVTFKRRDAAPPAQQPAGPSPPKPPAPSMSVPTVHPIPRESPFVQLARVAPSPSVPTAVPRAPLPAPAPGAGALRVKITLGSKAKGGPAASVGPPGPPPAAPAVAVGAKRGREDETEEEKRARKLARTQAKAVPAGAGAITHEVERGVIPAAGRIMSPAQPAGQGEAPRETTSARPAVGPGASTLPPAAAPAAGPSGSSGGRRRPDDDSNKKLRKLWQNLRQQMVPRNATPQPASESQPSYDGGTGSQARVGPDAAHVGGAPGPGSVVVTETEEERRLRRLEKKRAREEETDEERAARRAQKKDKKSKKDAG